MSNTISNTEELAVKLDELFIIDGINDILDEIGVPMDFWLTHKNIDDDNFLGFPIAYRLSAYLQGEEKRMNANVLRSITESALPYLRFIDSVLRKTQTKLSVKEIKCCEPKVDYTFEYMYVEFQTIDGSSSRSLTLKVNENREVEASI